LTVTLIHKKTKIWTVSSGQEKKYALKRHPAKLLIPPPSHATTNLYIHEVMSCTVSISDFYTALVTNSVHTYIHCL